jgi:hypothetical protein
MFFDTAPAAAGARASPLQWDFIPIGTGQWLNLPPDHRR